MKIVIMNKEVKKMDMYQKRKVRAEKRKNSENEKDLSKVSISWFPGHMHKTMKQIEEDLKLVDIVIEILDARIPMSSRNPQVQKLIKNKKKIIVLNKDDLADKNESIKWANYFIKQGDSAIICNANTGEGSKKIKDEINKVMKEEYEKSAQKGRVGKTVRAMILGIPNVGKSSFINRISTKNTMKVGNKPGVTTQKQWIRLTDNIELLDTPGVLWPKLDNEKVALNLAYTGTIKSDVIDEEEIAYNLTKLLLSDYKNNLINRYELNEQIVDKILQNEDIAENERIVEVMTYIGEKKNLLKKGGEVDFIRTSRTILEDFRSANLGRITLERVKE